MPKKIFIIAILFLILPIYSVATMLFPPHWVELKIDGVNEKDFVVLETNDPINTHCKNNSDWSVAECYDANCYDVYCEFHVDDKETTFLHNLFGYRVSLTINIYQNPDYDKYRYTTDCYSKQGKTPYCTYKEYQVPESDIQLNEFKPYISVPLSIKTNPEGSYSATVLIANNKASITTSEKYNTLPLPNTLKYGLPALIVIISSALVLIFLRKRNKKKSSKGIQPPTSEN